MKGCPCFASNSGTAAHAPRSKRLKEMPLDGPYGREPRSRTVHECDDRRVAPAIQDFLEADLERA